ncbi:hypothetical protein Syun_019462 [Stephania yunnanensis]|uniref:Zinc finger PHD-type domain-containing protein n=1 Tax=Stephania yunnanensis TaxID=152371 RepID=A0AAP0IVC7_9MAGN
MATNALEALKKKLGSMAKIFDYETFAEPGCPIILTGGFRENIRAFLAVCGDVQDETLQGMPVWSTLLFNARNRAVVPFYTIEETVKYSPRNPFCDHCRCTGWSHHFVSKRRYHFVIPADDQWNKPLDERVFDCNTHLLQGLIHGNGFGHLIMVNGREGGSRFLSGKQLMGLWDRICSCLRSWKITVEDTSRKKSMDLRLLYGIGYGHCWFGRWGYKFCHGSFGVTEHNYDAAIRVLTSLSLDEFIVDSDCSQTKQIIRIYREASETQLITISDLFRFMLTLKATSPIQRKTSVISLITVHPSKDSKPPTIGVSSRWQSNFSSVRDKPSIHRKFESFMTEMANSRWPARRLEYAAEVIVEALKEKQGGMSRQELRDAARLHIGDTGLLDFVIKSINNLVVGDYVVHRALNASKRVLEFTVKELNRKGTITSSDCPFSNQHHHLRKEQLNEKIIANRTSSATRFGSLSTKHDMLPAKKKGVAMGEPGLNVHTDIEFMYQTVLQVYQESKIVGSALRVVLDSKHFVKEWPFVDQDDELLRFICGVVPESAVEIEAGLTRAVMAPSEIVVVPLHATVGDLKRVAEAALRDTYCIMERYEVLEIEGEMDCEDEEEVLFGRFESGEVTWVRGRGMDLKSEFKYEGGDDNWSVDCICGGRDDDGERMVACDVCEVWQHTRCTGIQDDEAVPPLFVCGRCTASLMPPLSMPSSSSDLQGHQRSYMDLESY